MTITLIANTGVPSAATHEQYVTLMEAAPSGNKGMKMMGAMIAMMKVGKRYMGVKTMTVEERARELQKELANTFGRDHYDEVAREITAIEKALREQIEDCANVVKKEIELWDRESVGELRESILIALWEIRALAVPGESNQQKGD